MLSLFATHSGSDIALAAWLYPVFLIHFARTGRPGGAMVWLWAVSTAGVLFWLWRAELSSPPLLLIAVVLGAVQVVPFLVDRLAAPRLAARSVLLSTLVFPAAKVAAEFAQTSLSPVGGIYGVLGSTQHDALPLVQVSAVTGVYGVSFLVAWAAAVAAHALGAGRDWRTGLRAAVACTAVLGCVVLAGGARLALAPTPTESVRAAGVTLSEASYDANMSPAFAKYDSLEAIVSADPDQVRRDFAPINDELIDRTVREARAGADLVVWNESAAFTLEAHRDELLDRVREVAREYGIQVEVGMSVYTERPPYLRNQAVLVTSDGSTAWTYDKAHPIPVLEPYDAGSGETPLHDTAFGRLATAICYDLNFPATMRQAAAGGADIVLLPANEWAAIKKLHAEKAMFRAVEGGFTLVRPVGRGISTTVDPYGRTLAAADYFTSGGGSMVVDVPVEGVRTVYSRVGDLFAWACVAATLAGALLAWRRVPGARP
ncbi:nitrilase-related carbon-nitrogen hydrolase [Marinitenerispora sediminis]|uniref:nitrilase-related carbon-nitrogen hydrolase n=1 Tax=Marinitenerispora sediminis TaxID=1931232 RepID=UPI001F2DFF22|nr:nitrilase-related carbon-nitrogen hydrolase [Marinitenerispora sediminis]